MTQNARDVGLGCSLFQLLKSYCLMTSICFLKQSLFVVMRGRWLELRGQVNRSDSLQTSSETSSTCKLNEAHLDPDVDLLPDEQLLY